MTLEHDLRALADGFPETPELAPRVLAAIAARVRAAPAAARRACSRSRCSCSCRRRALAVSRDLRDRVLETFGLRDVEHPSASRTCPHVGPEARRLQLGSRVSLQQARRRPRRCACARRATLGAPDGIFEDALQSGVDVTFLYQPAHGRGAPRARASASS